MVQDSFGNRGTSRRTYQSFIDVGVDKTALRVNDATSSSNKLTVSAESVSFAAGAAGTTGIVSIDKAPIYNVDGAYIGEVGDTSFAWITGTILTTEVQYRQNLSDSEQFDILTNGQYAIDYDLGRIRYKKATAGTSDTCNYNSRQLNVDITGVEDIEIGAVELKDGTTDNRVEVKAPNGEAFGLGVKTIPARYMLTPPTLTDTFSSPLLLGSKNQLLTNIYDGTNSATLIVQDAAFGTASVGLPLFGKYQATPTTYTDNDAAPILLDANGRIVLSSDIEIGAVELKNGDDDGRAIINDANTARAATDNVVLCQIIDENGIVVGGSSGPAAVQALGTDATGADAYATVITTSGTKTHISVSLQGANDAIISLNAGVADHIYVPANSSLVWDDILVLTGVNIQAKNASAGNNYTNLAITMW